MSGGWFNMVEIEKIMSSQDFSHLYENFGQVQDSWFQSIFLYITEKCQLKCRHCYLGWRLKRGGMMSCDQIIAHLNIWKQLGAKKICFIGGEPTLHPKFKETVQYANTLGYEEVVMDTNGVPPALDVLSKFDCSDFAYIQVSLDGASPETHDRIRGKYTFKMTLNTIKELCNQGFDVRIICTVNKFNIKDYLNILKIADDIGVSLVKYHICSEEGRSKEEPQMIFNPYEWIEFTETLSSLDRGYKTKVLYQPTYAKRELRDRYFEEGYRGCIGRTLNKVSIFPDGKMYLCSYLFDTDLNFAEMIRGQIRVNRKFNELHLFTIQDKRCNSCQLSGICFGGCPAEKIVTGMSPCEKYPDIFPICRLWKVRV